MIMIMIYSYNTSTANSYRTRTTHSYRTRTTNSYRTGSVIVPS